MGELTAIGFRPGRSLLHRLDPRTKQALLMVLSMMSLWGGWFFCCFHRRDDGSLYVAGIRISRLIR
jgi:hypothetical protein